MIGSALYNDLATTVSAIGVIVSVFISLVLRSARRLAVEEQRASMPALQWRSYRSFGVSQLYICFYGGLLLLKRPGG